MTSSSKSREGEVRCLNCFARIRPQQRVEQASCPKCGIEWRISWPFPGMAKIRGPVWDSYPGRQ